MSTVAGSEAPAASMSPAVMQEYIKAKLEAELDTTFVNVVDISGKFLSRFRC
jgi:hypothetical protein